MAIYPKNTDDEVTAAEWNVVAAQADTAMQPTDNLAGLTNLPAARTNLALASVAASGDYVDLAGRPTDTTDTSDGLHYFVDPAGRVVATLGGDTFAMIGIALVAGGTSTFDHLAPTRLVTGSNTMTGGDGDGFNMLDAAGRRLLGVDAKGLAIGPLTVASGDGTGGLTMLAPARRVIEPGVFTYRARQVRFVDALDLQAR
jgi:hypothetical protein